MSEPLVIDYYSDILCVWAWIAQRRIDELHNEFGQRITLHYHYMDIFGDVPTKMATQWQDRGGYDGFAEHVQHSAAEFEDAVIHSRLWHEVRPLSSANAHLVLKAIELACSEQASIDMALQLRSAFFTQAQDIGNHDVLEHIITNSGLDTGRILASIKNGEAMASLMGDYRKAAGEALKGSPSYVMDGGRQTLYGNVGYRVLQANVEELLKNPADEASWC